MNFLGTYYIYWCIYCLCCFYFLKVEFSSFVVEFIGFIELEIFIVWFFGEKKFFNFCLREIFF